MSSNAQTDGDARTLPDEQQQIDDEDRKDRVELQTMERAENLSEQFEEIKDRTVDDDDVVLGRLADIETSANNDRIVVSIDLPAEGSDKTERFRKPKVWNDRYKFVRWIRHYGYDADSFPNMIRDDCRVRVLKDSATDYELFVPERDDDDGVVDTAGRAFGAMQTAVVRPIDAYLSQDAPYVTAVNVLTWLVLGSATLSGLVTLPMSAEETTGAYFIFGLLILSFGMAEVNFLENTDGIGY